MGKWLVSRSRLCLSMVVRPPSVMYRWCTEQFGAIFGVRSAQPSQTHEMVPALEMTINGDGVCAKIAHRFVAVKPEALGDEVSDNTTHAKSDSKSSVSTTPYHCL